MKKREKINTVGTDVGLHSEPGFVSNLRNVTVPEGRDVTLSCTVKNLQEHKVGSHRGA